MALGVAAYVTVLKKWFEARYQAIGDWIYRQFAGTALFRDVALRKYRAALVQNYQHLPMPFLKNRDPLKMSEVYVPLKVSEPRKSQGTAAEKSTHPPLDALKAMADYRRLMVIGEPGSGKSVLLKYLAWAYGSGQLDTLADRPTVVLLELYRLSDGTLNRDKLLEKVVEAFDRNQFPKAKNLVEQGLERGTLMLLLDGLDEVNSDVRSHVVGVIRDLLKTYSRCRVVITCRTAVYDNEFSDIVDRRLEVVEFTDQQMRRFLKAWEPEMIAADKSVNQMMAALQERPLILKLARNPLLLTLVAYLYVEPSFVLPHSRAEFYKESTALLLDQRNYKGDDEYKYNSYPADKKRRVLQHLALYTQDHSTDLKDRRSLAAEVVREEIRAILPTLDIDAKEARPLLKEITDRSGLLMEIDGGERYLFPHLTLQEYFAAAALKDRDRDLIQRFEADPVAWREVVKLGCSLANDSTDLVSAVYKRDPITGLECLAEASQVEPALANQIIEDFKQKIDQPQPDDTLARAFGAVAASSQPRGQAMFSFLEATLFDSKASDSQYTFAAEALSRTNLPKAVAVLVRWYQDSELIVRMGDLAVPKLTELAQTGVLQALQELFEIATPDAANALVPLLWSNQHLVAGQAAWYLGSLLTQPDIEAALREFKLTPHQRRAETTKVVLKIGDDNGVTYLRYGKSNSREDFLWNTTTTIDWIWEPFNEPNHSALPNLTSRIVYLLKECPWASHSVRPPNLDPRLVVPLCTLCLQPSNLPTSLPDSVEALLEQPEHTPRLDPACREARDQWLAPHINADNPWRILTATVPPQVELDLISRLIRPRQPERRHWRTLFEVVDYDLRTSWHYRGTLLIAALLSIIALVGAGIRAYINYENPWLVATFSIATMITLVFWLTLWQGIEAQWEPTLFADLGLQGVIAFTRYVFGARRKKIIWPGFETIFAVVTGLAVVLAFAVGSALAFAVAVAFGSAVALAFGGTFISTVGFIVGITFVGVGSFALTVIVVVANAWNTLKVTLGQPWLYFVGFPWFCWLPIVSVLSTWALYDFLAQVSPLALPLWQQTALGVAVVASIWVALWHRGLWLEARARNPFHGGHWGPLWG